MAKDLAAIGKARQLEREDETITVGSPTVFELFAGVALSRKAEEEKSKIMTILSSLPQLALDFPSAREGGTIYGEKIKTGRAIDPEDAMLAGIAKAKAERVSTRIPRVLLKGQKLQCNHRCIAYDQDMWEGRRSRFQTPRNSSPVPILVYARTSRRSERSNLQKNLRRRILGETHTPLPIPG